MGTSEQAALERLHEEIATCDWCVRAGFIPRAHPIFRGRAGMRLMVVGQAPGALAYERPAPYMGATGRTLGRWLKEAGFSPGSLHACCYLTSLTKCFPGPSRHGKGDRAPSAAEIALCREHLDREIALVRPRVVLTLGRLAASALVPRTRGALARLAELVGSVWEAERAGHRFLVVPLPHPSGVSRWLNDGENRERVGLALARLGELRVNLDLEGGPRAEVPVGLGIAELSTGDGVGVG
jgi:uracil-DNA glycosylase family 4